MRITKILGRAMMLAVCFGLLTCGIKAATFTVINTDDLGDGSLRGAVTAANNNPGDDMVVFDPSVFSTPQTITLNDEILVGGNGNIEIMGPGTDLITIVTFNSPRERKFSFRLASSQLTLSRVKTYGLIVHNDATARVEYVSFRSNGIANFGNTTVNSSLFDTCSNALGNIGGGAIFNSPNSTMEISRSIISNNSSVTGSGGIGNYGTLTINESAIKNNSVSSGSSSVNGGGLFNQGGFIVINNSQITGNQTSNGNGGGIYIASGSIFLYNTTISGNLVQGGNGGGIYCSGSGGAYFTNVTVAANSGGSNIVNLGSNVRSRNSLFADFSGAFNSLGYNLIANATGTTISGTTTGNQLNVNPQLAPLANNGGLTQTHALLPNSPAINAGNNALALNAGANPFRFEQRGACFQRFAGSAVDIGAFEVQTSTIPLCSRAFDFSGDGTTDFALFRPADGDWYFQSTTNGTTQKKHFGLSGDIPQAADYDGDGRTDLAVYRPNSRTWFVSRSSDGNFTIVQFGLPDDKPVAADYDGDGRAELAVFRPSTGVWWILNPANSSVRPQQWGIAEDKPVPADYDGDGKADIAVFRPSTGVWWILNSRDNSVRPQRWGLPEDKPVAGDYDGDGRADLAVWRPSSGYWYALRSTNDSMLALPWGISGDIPQTGDYDGDNRADFIVWRPLTTTWYVFRSSNASFIGSIFGAAADLPVSSSYRIE